MAIYELDGVKPTMEGEHWIADSASVMGRKRSRKMMVLKTTASASF